MGRRYGALWGAVMGLTLWGVLGGAVGLCGVALGCGLLWGAVRLHYGALWGGTTVSLVLQGSMGLMLWGAVGCSEVPWG